MTVFKETKQTKSIDDMLKIVGEYGRFQKIVNAILCIMTLPPIFHIMIMYFAANDPDWKCVQNQNSTCPWNGTFSTNDERRCGISREDWEYTMPKEYSIVTYFDVHCSDKWQLELLTSIFFVGWLLGAFVLGWFCDNYGRKLVLIVSVNVVIVTGFLTIFMPSLHYIVACRFVIGFFLPGTMYQSFIIITELVGNKYRSFSGLMVFVFGIVALTVVGIKAYFIRDWKLLHVCCTVPYILGVLSYRFIPESVRFLRVKGKMEELMVAFHRIAYWNNTEIPLNVTVSPPPKEATEHKSNPTHLFRTRSLAIKTSIQVFGYFTAGLVYYGVFLAAGDIGGSLYRDYIIISGTEIPIIFISMDFCERFGRKKTSTIPMIFACFACIALSFIPKVGDLKIARVITGMIGKCLVGSNMNTLSTWSSELYTTQIRGEAMGFFQAFVRLGASVSPWLDKEFVKIHKSASFLFMAAISFVSFSLLTFLPETRDTVTGDAEGEGEEFKEVNIVGTFENNNEFTLKEIKDYTNDGFEVTN